ncbi:ComEC/Rec2 family competence protein [Prevotella sp. A2931]|uniref:ComEC/Rec2 family competence protein n=1 Tax=Prevotella illustrans TaxID=2800387 RepID=A0ABS3M4B2_9BACT|nr:MULTISPECIES: ComEC/Rec2 family competence protein [Prevotella]MBO1363012.1 ComEC/Rec2 family competence protein [Prevotella illustrans]
MTPSLNIRNYLQLNPLLRVAVMLISGIAAGEYLQLSLSTFLLLCGVSLLAALLCRGKGQSLAILTATALLGGLLITFYHYRTDRPLPTGSIHYQAVIISQPQPRGKIMRCDLLVTALEGTPLQRSMKVRAAILRHDDRHDSRLSIGNGLMAEAEIKRPRNTTANPRFDYQRWMRVHGYEGETFIPYWKYHTAIFPLHISRLEKAKLRALTLRERLAKDFRQSQIGTEEQSLLLAMTLGDKSMLSQQTRDDFSKTGSSHILALSGLHLSIIYFMLLALFRSNLAGNLLSLAAIWAYAVMVGLPPSVVRSATMITIYGLIALLHRDKMSMNTLSLTAIIMLVIHPMSLWDVGFQLSFMAVAGIFIYFGPISRAIQPRFRPLKWFTDLMATSLAAQLTTAPLVLHYFGRLATYFLLTNLIVIPLTTLILYGAVIVFATTFFPFVHNLLLRLVGGLATLLVLSVQKIATLPGASIDHFYLSNQGVWLCYSLMALSTAGLWLWHKRRLNRLPRTEDPRA